MSSRDEVLSNSCTRIFEVVKSVRFRLTHLKDDVDESREALPRGTLLTASNEKDGMIEVISRDFGRGWIPMYDGYLKLKGTRSKAPGRPTQAMQIMNALKSKLKNEETLSSSLKWLQSMIIKQPTKYTTKFFQNVMKKREDVIERIKKSESRRRFRMSTGVAVVSMKKKISDDAIIQCFDDLLDMYSLHHSDMFNEAIFKARQDCKQSEIQEMKRKEEDLRKEMTQMELESRREFEEWKTNETIKHEKESKQHLEMKMRRSEVAAEIADEIWSRDIEPRMRVRYAKQFEAQEASICDSFLSRIKRQEQEKETRALKLHEIAMQEAFNVAQDEARMILKAERDRAFDARSRLRLMMDESKREERRLRNDEIRSLESERNALRSRNEMQIEIRERKFRRDVLHSERYVEQRVVAERSKVAMLLKQESLQ